MARVFSSSFLCIVIVVVVSTTATTAISTQFPVKHLAGLPSEFASHSIPDPSTVLTTERSASILVWFSPSSDNIKNNNNNSVGLIYSTAIPVDGPNQFVFTLTSPQFSELQVELIDPQGKIVDLNPFKTESYFAIGSDIELPTTAYHIENSVEGYYTLNIRSTTLRDADLELLANSAYPNAVLTVINNDYVEIESHLSTYLIKQGEEIGIISTIIDLSPTATVENIRVTSALMEVITPSGEDIEVPMTDDDMVLERFGIPPHSGVYGARFVGNKAGQYVVQAKLQGLFSDTTANEDVPFLRSTEHVLDVSAATVSLTGTSQVRPIDSEHVAIDIGVTGEGETLRAYAEVWGLDMNTHEPKPACWIGGVVEIDPALHVVTLELDLKWLTLAGVTSPLTLHNVYISDLTTLFPVAISSSSMKVENSQNLIKIDKYLPKMQITKEMRFGKNPLESSQQRIVSADVPNLLLLPGYCSSKNPWLSSQDIFSQAAYFNSNGANIGNHEYSERVLAFATSLGMNSYSIIGHSQGGMVAAHIMNYFFSGLDNAVGERRIQSVGTPYQGCSAAGFLADLGRIFGIACGSNNDLSLDGAANWLTGISSEVRSQINYYTTSYELGTFFGDWCNLPMNLILQWPNDGTTEKQYATIQNAIDRGNKEKWCHTTNMKYAPQTDDRTRNAEMNQKAAR